VKVYGWGEYSIVEDEVVRSFPVCNECWVYHPYNTGADAFKEAPVRRVLYGGIAVTDFLFLLFLCLPAVQLSS
jgi:hypothetical protein